MSEIFLNVVNMSISAGYIVLAVLLLRWILKKTPKWISVVLWGIVGVRLICPISIESIFSLIPRAEVVSPEIMLDRHPQINTGIPVVNQVINPVISQAFTPDPATSANPLQLWIPTFAVFWVMGIAAMVVYAIVSYARVKHKIGTAVRLRDNLYQSENVDCPFVLGIIKPKIYLPFYMQEKDMAHIVAHETAHIRRKDYLWKPLGFLLLTIHWFNPLMWLGYILLCRDIELACDEKVIKELDRDARADYSQTILTCGANRRIVAACPLAFGEVGVKDRVKSVLCYKKPAFWLVATAMVACVAVAICFLTNPKNTKQKPLNAYQMSLKVRYPQYFGLDASRGLDIYVWQMAKDNYSFGLLPHSEIPRNAVGEELTNLVGVRAGEMYAILASYSTDRDDMYIIPFHHIFSSYVADWQIVTDGENAEAKRKAFAESVEKMLFENVWLGETEGILGPVEQKVDLSAQIPPQWDAIVADNLFYDAVAFGDRLLKAESTGRSEKVDRTANHRVTMLDKYGAVLAQYTCTTDDAYRVGTLTATADGGFLFVLAFHDYFFEGGWASDKGFASRVIKCDSRGEVEFDTAFESVEGGALQCCIEKDGRFYFFGHRQMPETKQQGIYSVTDIFMTVLDGNGRILNTKYVSGTNFDSFNAAGLSGDKFILSVDSQSDDGDFAGSDSGGHPVDWVLTVDDNLNLVKKEKKSGRDYLDDRLGEKNGKPIYKSDPLLKKFDAGTPTAFIDYGDYYLIVSENPTGIYEHTPPMVSAIWYYWETVYSAYDSDGKLIYRKAVNSTPDYDNV